MTTFCRVTLEESGLQPLSLLWGVDGGQKDRVREALKALTRDELIRRYRQHATGADGNRVAAYVLAEELTRREVPPCFRLHHIRSRALTLNQESDLLAHDLQWIVHRYPGQVKEVDWVKWRAVFTATNTGAFLSACEFLHYFGNRSMGEIARGLRLDDDQQWDCMVLRSDHINRIARKTDEMRAGVMEALKAFGGDYTSSAYTEDDARQTLLRRHRLWQCSRMSRKGKGRKVSPAKTAMRYEQMTGDAMPRNLAAKHLTKIETAIKKYQPEQLC